VDVVNTTSTTYALGSAEGQYVVMGESGTATVNLSNIATTGENFCIYAETAQIIIVNPDDSDTITFDATTDTAGHQIASDATIGNFSCFLATSTTNWVVLGRAGTWTPGA
jgi:hypothetical protein